MSITKVPFELLVKHLSAVALKDNHYAEIHVRYILSELRGLGLLKTSDIEYPPVPRKIRGNLILVKSEAANG